MQNDSTYNLVALGDEIATVVSEYKRDSKKSSSIQSESDLERDLIQRLQGLGYEYLENLNNEESLIENLKKQIEALNNISFSNTEWNTFFASCIASNNDDIVKKAKKIQGDDYLQNLIRDDGSNINIKLIEKNDVLKNKLQVINQYKNKDDTINNRYDITILVNGLPLVHIELKKRGVDIKEAFNQISRYQKDSFSSKSGLFDYIQIFVISNGTYTKYYSNTTRYNHIKNFENNPRKTKTSNSFEFTSYWADEKNKNLMDLVDFTNTFLSKRTLLNVLTKYCILNVDDILLVMRPYQIVACEKIIQRTKMANVYKKFGSKEAGGYIWHTTGSGKTLTSFKTAGLISKLGIIDKVLFIVDRKDLDYQTIREYNKFEKDCVSSNTSTKILTEQLNNSNKKIIVTTIQKLNKFIQSNENSEIFNQHIVMIFDECHRSQFGEFHEAITKKFKKYYLFGFTGTPIFDENKSFTSKKNKTTMDVFGDKLHSYTIINAISDKNVLPFKVSYHNTIEAKENIKDKQVMDINDEEVLSSKKRIQKIAQYIIDNFDTQTKRKEKSFTMSYTENISELAKNKKVEERKTIKRVNGFNSILAVSSIENAKTYYESFKGLDHNLKIATIFSIGNANKDDDAGFDDDEEISQNAKEFFDKAINDYNENFRCTYSAERFDEYYKDLSLRVKNREIDILIVVNMFLTGFDATTLNTLWVDKNLKFHGLIQAFSRTNRILNSIKTFGNIVCFRNLNKNIDEALVLYGDGDKEATKNIILLRPYNDYINGYEDKGIHYDGYLELIKKLRDNYPLGEAIVSKNDKKGFLKLYGSFLKIKNILESFEEFEPALCGEELQDYQSMYINTYDELKSQNDSNNKESILEDVVFEIELINSININVDYILNLLGKITNKESSKEEVKISVNKIIDSNINLRSKKELINNFIETININSDIYTEWNKYIKNKKEEELDNIIKDENLNKENAKKFMQNSFENGYVNDLGTDLDNVIPKVSLFKRGEIKARLVAKLREYHKKYSNI